MALRLSDGRTEQPVFVSGKPAFRIVAGLGFCLGSYLGNAVNVDLFFGVNFLFGSTFVWLALITLGPSWAIPAATVGALYTVDLWGHGNAAIILMLEAITVTTLCRFFSTNRLSALVLAYWLFVGIPIGLYLYSVGLGLPKETVHLVIAKQALNGLLNAMVAALVLTTYLFLFPNVRASKNLSEANSYSGLLQATFGLAFLVPILMSEFSELEEDFQVGVQDELAQSKKDVLRSSKNIASLLKLETVFWGASISDLVSEGREEKIQKLMAADTSGAPSQAFRVMEDGGLQMLFGPGTSLQPSERVALNLVETSVSPMGYLLGCHDGDFISLYTAGPKTDSFVFVWSDQSVTSALHSRQPDQTLVKCMHEATEELKEKTDTTSVDLVRDTDRSVTELRSWLDSTVQSRTTWASLTPALLEVTFSLRPNVLKIQKETFNAVQRLCILAFLIVLGGQILDILFRNWVKKFVRISEAYLTKHESQIHALNVNFREDRAITEWLDRFAMAFENEELKKRHAQSNFQMLLAQASTPVFATNNEGQIKIWNPALQELSGYSEDELLGTPISDILEVQSDASMNHVRPKTSELLYDVRTKGGGAVHLVVSQLRIDALGPEHNLGRGPNVSSEPSTSYFIAQNLSDLRDWQAKVLSASRLAALGEMASAFAHELNQPLNVITMTAGNLLERAKNNDVPQEYLISKSERIEKQALRAGKIIQEVRKFVLQDDEVGITAFDPMERVRSASDLVSEQMRIESVSVSINAPIAPLKITGRAILFEQSIVNLLVNAKQALRSVDVANRQIHITAVSNGRELTILVRDTGPGIQKSNLRRVFDPFFTTKQEAGGSGIGLHMTRSVIAELGGSIRAVEVGLGACFEIKVPLTLQQDDE